LIVFSAARDTEYWIVLDDLMSALDHEVAAAKNLECPVSFGFASADLIESRWTAAHRRDDDAVKGQS